MAATRLDYQAASNAIRQALPTRGCTSPEGRYAACRSIAEQLAEHFARSNPKFDRELFLRNAGVTHG